MKNTYRKRPLIVEAVKFNGDNPEELAKFTGFNTIVQPGNSNLDLPTFAVIDTGEGYRSIEEGKWLIRGIKDELYVCDDDVFQETYEEV